MAGSDDRASRGPGRRPGAPDTRGAILAAAMESFAERGYDMTTIRGVARDAGVDPSLVHHYFGGKHELFLQAMDLPVDPEVILSSLLDGDVESMGERLVRAFLGVWESPAGRTRMVGLVSAVVTNENAQAMLRGAFTSLLFDRIGPHLPQGDARMRMNAVASQLIGLAMVRYIVKFEPIASADLEDVVRMVAPNVQRYMTGDL